MTTHPSGLPALEELVNATLALTDSGLLQSNFDPDWRSPCEVRTTDDLTYWKPVSQAGQSERHDPVDFSGLANALEAEIHPDIVKFYGHYWSGTLEAESQEGRVSLIQLWNPEDFDRLIRNLIGHAMVKQRQKQPFSVFIANTEPDSELFLSIDNTTGVVLLEEPGKQPIREVEADVHAFLRRLQPKIRPPDIY